MPALPPYDAAIWQAKAGQLEYERNLLLRYLDMRDDSVTRSSDPDFNVEYHNVYREVQKLRERIRAHR